MAKFTVKQEAWVAYSMTTWQGKIELDGQEIQYRYSEDDNGVEVYFMTEAGWEAAGLVGTDWADRAYAIICAAAGEWGSPEEFGSAGELVEVDDELVEDYM